VLAQATTVRPVAPRTPLAKPAAQGPFTMHANARHAGGDVARGLNRVATTPNSETKIPFRGSTLTVTRDAEDSVSVETPIKLPPPFNRYSLHATGKMERTHGKQEIAFSQLQFSTNLPNAKIDSVPSKIVFSARTNGDMVYTIDKAIDVSVHIPFIGKRANKLAAGSYIIYENPEK
jgi:hypothetical protein